MTKRKLLLAVLLITFLFRFLFVMNSMFHIQRAFATWPDTWEYETVAWNLTNGRGYSLHEHSPYFPTMLVTPSYPYLITAIYAVSGGRNFQLVLLTNLILAVISAGLIFGLTINLTKSEKAAFWSALLFGTNPNAALYTGQLIAETLYITLILLSFLIVIQSKWARWSKVAIFGVVSGLLLLTKPAGVVPVLFALLYALWKHRDARWLIALPIALMVVFPWLNRNHERFGMWKFSSVTDMTLTIYHAAPVMSDIHDVPLDSAAIMLYGRELYEKVANRYPNPFALDTTGQIARRFIQKNLNRYTRLLLTGLPVVVFMPMSMAEYARFIGRQPGRSPVAQEFLRDISKFRIWSALKTVYRKRLSVLGTVGAIGYLYAFVFNLFFLILVLIGWIRFPERRFAITILVMSLFVLVPVGICPSPRYRLPVSPLWSIFAGYGLTTKWRRKA